MRILHVGLPSIHMARWIKTLGENSWEHHVYPVTPMAPWSELTGVTVHYPGPDRPPGRFPGVTILRAPTCLEGGLLPGIGARRVPLPSSQILPETIRAVAPDVIHAHGIQVAGYAVEDARAEYGGPFPPWIVSCWGSDIYHYISLPEHADRIKAVLQSVDGYVADSRRDVDLAQQYGLRGDAFQIASVSGGFDLANLAKLREPGPTSARRTIMLKARHVWVYRGLVAMEALRRNADLLDGYRLVLYYVDDQAVWREAAATLARESGIKVEILPQVSYDEILRRHGQARISLSLTISDGVNISFLEAMAMGSFPIQSRGSATTEWADHGETALFAEAESVDAVAAAIRRALTDDALVDRAADINLGLVQDRLNIARMRAPATELYQRIAERAPTGLVAIAGHSGAVRLARSAVAFASNEASDRRPARDASAAGRTVGPSSEEDVEVRASARRGVRLTAPQQPLVTVITPTYNRADLLPETIESILNQDYPNLEYIVLDDGSTDDTPAVLRRYGDAIRWERHPNMGQPRTVNRGLELAQGEIIGLVSSDDPLLPGAISALVEALQQHREVLVVYPDWDVIDLRGHHLYTVKTLEYSFVDMVRWHHTFPGPGALFRRSVVDRIGGYDPAFRGMPDYDFWVRAGLLGPFRRVPQTLAAYRSHPTAITLAERGLAMAREHIQVLDKLYARTDLPTELLAVKLEAYRNAFFIAGLVAQVNVPFDERFALTDSLFKQQSEPQTSPPIDAAPELRPVEIAGAIVAPITRRNAVAAIYDRLSASRVGQLKSAVPIEWRIATRRWLSKAGR